MSQSRKHFVEEFVDMAEAEVEMERDAGLAGAELELWDAEAGYPLSVGSQIPIA